jgi:hypothetical protein
MSDPAVDGGMGDDGVAPTLLDLALLQGRQRDLDALRQRIANDPFEAIAFAETRDFLERMQGLACEPSEGFQARMEGLVHAAQTRRGARPAVPMSAWVACAAAAAALFVALSWLDPLSLRGKPVEPRRHVVTQRDVTPEPVPYIARPIDATIAKTIEATQRMAKDTPLASAMLRFERDGANDRLAGWLSPRNAVGFLRLDRELRATAGERMAALRDAELARGLQHRVEQLADEIAADAGRADAETARAAALALRSLVAAGPRYDDAAIAYVRSLEARLGTLHGGDLAMALCALAEAAVSDLGVASDALQQHGERWIASVLVVDDEVWSRRRPRMLLPSEPAAGLAAGGRFCRMAPELGIDSEKAKAVRLLLLAHLEERRNSRVETPDVPTAMVYGFGDLLASDERAGLEKALRNWRPESLVPDYLSLQQFAASRGPEVLGFARWQLELRRVAALSAPADLGDRGALCLCLLDCMLATEDRGTMAGI